MNEASEMQDKVCKRYDVRPQSPDSQLKAGVARNIGSGIEPINGLRVQPTESTCGWYLWAGAELSQDDDFFEPVCISHLSERCPEAVPYLALPPGWRFLIAPNHEDVWCDGSLLED